MKKSILEKAAPCALLFYVVIAVFLINYLTPYLADDFGYLKHYIWNTQETMTSFSDFISSCKLFYLNWGGRILPYIFINIFAWMPKWLFALLNTSAYLGGMYLMYKICSLKRNRNVILLFLICILLWFTVPDYGQVMFWMSGAGNYLYTSLLVFGMLLIFRNYGISGGTCYQKKWCIFAIALEGFFSGLAMENMSCALSVMLTLYLFLYKKRGIKLRPCIVCGYAFHILGVACLLFSPGNAARKSAEEGVSRIVMFMSINYYWVVCVGMICALWAALCYLMKKKHLQLVCESSIFMIGAVCAAYCMIAAPSLPERTWYIVCAYAVLACGILFSEWVPRASNGKTFLRIIVTGAGILFVVLLADTGVSTYELHSQDKARAAYIRQEIEKGNKDIATPVFTHRFPLKAKHDALEGLSDIKSDPNFWINVSVAGYYGINSIRGIDTK